MQSKAFFWALKLPWLGWRPQSFQSELFSGASNALTLPWTPAEVRKMSLTFSWATFYHMGTKVALHWTSVFTQSTAGNSILSLFSHRPLSWESVCEALANETSLDDNIILKTRCYPLFFLSATVSLVLNQTEEAPQTPSANHLPAGLCYQFTRQTYMSGFQWRTW